MCLWVSLEFWIFMILPFLGCSIVKCQGKTWVKTIDAKFSVTPGFPKLSCPKSKEPYYWSFSLQNPNSGAGVHKQADWVA